MGYPIDVLLRQLTEGCVGGTGSIRDHLAHGLQMLHQAALAICEGERIRMRSESDVPCAFPRESAANARPTRCTTETHQGVSWSDARRRNQKTTTERSLVFLKELPEERHGQSPS